ncbi:MAG: DUF1161 domain-containing protein [Burkholderiales bacterium]|nr:DUF1161 domain-containing protein [Burkholderiales bacterium]
MRTQRLVVLALCAVAASPAIAATCEELMATIEARIRANGVAQFTVTAVDHAASAAGKQVGTCDLGRKKIMYLRAVPPSRETESAAAAPAASSASASASRPGVITECADGRVIRDGSCKK